MVMCILVRQNTSMTTVHQDRCRTMMTKIKGIELKDYDLRAIIFTSVVTEVLVVTLV